MRTRTHIYRPGSRAKQRGIALVMVLFAMATLLLVTASGFLVGASGSKATRNYRGATQVHFVAESAISQALQAVNGAGVINFQNDVVGQWPAVWGSTAKPFAPLTGFSYTVTPVQSVADPANAGRLIATANGLEGARNLVVANVIRSDVPSTAPGAIYLATDAPTNSNFTGNAFLIDGNDHNYTGGLGPAAPVPGLATRNDTNTQEALNSLSGAEKDNVTGLGYSSGPPIVPSVKTSPAAPTVTQLDQMIADLLLMPHDTWPSDQIVGNQVFGTTLAPKITYCNASDGLTIKGAGTVDGAGILIIDGDLSIEGTLDFKGLVLVRGHTNVIGDTTLTGTATIYGSLWTNDIDLVVGGSAICYYSTQALSLANQVAAGKALPAPLQVISLADCSQLPAGSGGCP